MTSAIHPCAVLAEKPELDEVHSLRILTLNTHKGFTTFNRFVLPELREAVRAMSTDVVFLQEVLGSNIQYPQRYPNWPVAPQYEFLADRMWSNFSYGRNAIYPHGDHGNALLSKFPIIRYENIDISIGKLEQRGLLHSVLAVPGHTEVHAICVHLGLRPSHRHRQLDLLGQLLNRIDSTAPVIIAGDFNDWFKEADNLLAPFGVTEAFVQKYNAPARTFPAPWPLLCLDRIYVRNATTHNPEVLHKRPWSHLSDHVPLTAEIRI